MTSKQMRKAKLPPGYIFWNTAPLGAKPNWKIVPAPEGWCRSDKSAARSVA